MNAATRWTSVWARFRPDHEVVFDVGTGRRWTWAEFHRETLRWTGRLLELGVRRGDRVAVLAYNRAETLALLFACGELGAVLFPMNWRLSRAELTWQLEHATPRVLFADAPHHDFFGGAFSLDDVEGHRPVEGPGCDASDPWVLMYTSGSSGRPKGALLTHQQLLANATTTILACDLTASDATLTFAPLFHTGGLNCLTTPLLHRGGRIVLVPKLDPGEALALIEREAVTLLMGVPTIYQMLSDHKDFQSADLSLVRDALCGGASLPLALLERYQQRNIPLRQGFGLTEVGPNCFSMPHRSIRQKSGSVGLPIHHASVRLVRPDGSTCPVGEPGELLLGGPLVFGGYWRDPDATRAAVSDGWFRTGDLLEVDADGYYYVRGRIKEMYKSGGENVYPAEVEAAILEHPAIANAAVVGVPDERWGEVGRAFVEVRDGISLTPEALLDFLSARLARFKLPKQIHVAGALPRTGSGKIDKAALARQGSA